MRKIMLAAAMALAAISLGSCTSAQFAIFQQDVAKLEAKVANFVAAVKKNLPIALADAQAVVGEACAVVPTAQSQVASFTATVSNPPASVQSALAKATQYAATAQAACTTYNAQLASGSPPSLSATVNFAVTIWNAYQAGKQAYRQATQAASGS